MLLTQIGNGVSTTTTPLCGRMPQIIESISEGPLFAISAVNVESLIVRVTLSLSPRLAFLFTSKDSLPSMLAFAFSHCTVTLARPIFGFFDVHLRVFARGQLPGFTDESVCSIIVAFELAMLQNCRVSFNAIQISVGAFKWKPTRENDTVQFDGS